MLVPDVVGSTDRGAVVPCGRLDVQLLEWRLITDPAVGNSVESDAAGKSEVLRTHRGMESVDDVQIRLFQKRLQGRGNVLVSLQHRLVALSSRSKELFKPGGKQAPDSR